MHESAIVRAWIDFFTWSLLLTWRVIIHWIHSTTSINSLLTWLLLPSLCRRPSGLAQRASRQSCPPVRTVDPSAQSGGSKSEQVRQCMDLEHCPHWLHLEPNHLLYYYCLHWLHLEPTHLLVLHYTGCPWSPPTYCTTLTGSYTSSLLTLTVFAALPIPVLHSLATLRAYLP
jgi:hypothetical protein